ncbi:peptidylprolyl isomerase [Rhodohalobacter halophilus]|uniref:peptidylprolyl isomerase n=1 Tax=Rhodohalobacter halophilus TaxID=1812810 RepID=UPI00083F697E|nr:peptidylprolyl isomerase [Rhodohalobacter halophilus]
MTHFLKSLLFLTAIITILASSLFARQGQVADRIVAVVNDRIILKSDVDDEVRNYMNQSQAQGQNVEFSEDLWYSALQSMVDNYVMLEQAEVDSITVSDEMVNRQMDIRINELVRQAGGERALEEAFGKSIIQLRADFRDQFREQMVVQRVQQQKMGEITITRPEVIEFFNSIPDNELPMIPEQVGISQIVIIPQPLEDAQNQAFRKAEALRDSILNHGAEFEAIARRHSEDVSAQRGGSLPLMPINDLVANYSAAATALNPGEVSEIVRTEFGYHIIRLDERRGDQIATSHVLIKIDDTQVDEDSAIEKLEAIRDSVLNHGKTFSDMARAHSEDPRTKDLGGRISNPQTGERLIPINQLEPSLYRIVLLLEEEGQISEPRSFNPPQQNVNRAFRIVRLDRHVPEHKANLEQDYERLRAIALQQKQMQEFSTWLENLRDQFFIEFKIPMPDVDALQDPLMDTPVETEAEMEIQQ